MRLAENEQNPCQQDRTFTSSPKIAMVILGRDLTIKIIYLHKLIRHLQPMAYLAPCTSRLNLHRCTITSSNLLLLTRLEEREPFKGPSRACKPLCTQTPLTTSLISPSQAFYATKYPAPDNMLVLGRHRFKARFIAQRPLCASFGAAPLRTPAQRRLKGWRLWTVFAGIWA